MRAVEDLGLALAVGIAFAVAVAVAVAIAIAVAIALLLTRRLGSTAPPALAAPPRAAASGRARVVVAAVAAAVLASGWALLPHLGLRSDLRGFAEGVPAVADAAHVEQVMGSSGEFTLAVSGPDTMTREALSWMSRAQDQLITAHGDQLRPVVSPPTLLSFLGHAPTDGQLDAALRLLPSYLTSSVFSADHRLAVLTFATRLDDAQRLLSLRDQIRAGLPPPAGLSVELTGLPMAARRRDPGLRRAVGLAAAASAVEYATLGFSGLAVVSQFGVLLAGAVGLAYAAARLLVWLLPPTAATGAPASSPTPEPRPMVAIG